MMNDKELNEHFEDEMIRRQMIKKSLSYQEAQKALAEWKKENKKDYQNAFDNWYDDTVASQF